MNLSVVTHDKLCDFNLPCPLPHGILLEGENMKALLDTALYITMSAMCTSEGITRPCKSCDSCLKIEKTSHPDVKIINPQGTENSIKIEDIRFLKEDAYTIPNESNLKFYIIAKADLLTKQAQNAFLKVLEEPPPAVRFIILCKSSRNLLSTVRSRLQFVAVKQKNEETSSLAREILEDAINGQSAELFEHISKVPNNRIFAKNLIEDIMKALVEMCAVQEYGTKNSIRASGIFDKLRNLLSACDRNANFNLLMCCLCAALQG